MKAWLAPHGLHVEPARIDDAGELARLHAQGFYRGWPSSDFATYLGDDAIRAYVACDSRRRIAGFAMFRLAGDEAELITIAVDRKWRGRKIGLALLRAGFEDLLMSPARAVFLEVAETNAPALKLYAGLGFARVGTRRGYYPQPDGSPATALVMRRDLE